MRDITSSHLYFEVLEKLLLSPQWETDYGLISYVVHHQTKYLFHSKLPLNSHLSSFLSTNKHATHIVLEKLSLPTIPYLLPQSTPQIIDFLKIHDLVIIKPTRGMKSQHVALIKNDTQLKELKIPISEVIVEKYIAGTEYRYLYLAGEIIGVQKKHLTPVKNRPWKKIFENLAENEWDTELMKLSKKTCTALGLVFGAVDFIVDLKKIVWILEVNSAPGIKYFHHPDIGKPNYVAKKIIEQILKMGK